MVVRYAAGRVLGSPPSAHPVEQLTYPSTPALQLRHDARTLAAAHSAGPTVAAASRAEIPVRGRPPGSGCQRIGSPVAATAGIRMERPRVGVGSRLRAAWRRARGAARIVPPTLRGKSRAP